MNLPHPRLPDVPAAAADLAERVRVLAEVVAGLLERIDILEEQRGLLASKLNWLESR